MLPPRLDERPARAFAHGRGHRQRDGVLSLSLMADGGPHAWHVWRD
jgi:hypothetical protein